MAKRAITEEAKQIVLAHGPSNSLEFTGELVENHLGGIIGLREIGHGDDQPDLTEDDYQALYDETRKQAGRVYVFLGYVNPVEGE